MKSFVLIFLSVLFVPVTVGQNIPVETEEGKKAYVEPEELLEKALQFSLKHHNIREVDVDRLNDNDNTGFIITVKSNGDLVPNFQTTFENIVRHELGVSIITVRAKKTWRRRHQYDEATYYVYLDPETSSGELKSLAQNTVMTTYLDLKDKPN
ncbi:UNVERIFIED_CONTAM: hypothetical protein RMT77_016184 [Armadillidium vulgare]